MLASFIIMLREGIEAALIAGIVASCLKQSGRGEWLPAVWTGAFLAIALSLFVGAGLIFAGSEMPQRAQEVFEAIVGFIAVAVLVSMVFWMRRVARTFRSDVQRSIDKAMAAPAGASWALVGMVFFAVAREGLESVFFLLAIFQQSEGPAAALGALAGVLVAVAVGYGIFQGGIRLDLRRFFRWTGVFIIVVAAGLLASVLRNLHEAGFWNLLQTPAYDLSGILPEQGLFGALFAGLFNYREAPTMGEAIVYVVFLVITLVLFLRPAAAPVPAAAGNRQEA